MLPTGTVTFLFTDIQDSTPLWEREPEKMALALQVHNQALHKAIEGNGGMVFKIVGDAFDAAFPTALQALKAAIDGQRALQAAPWNALGPLKVRMGLHTGEAELDPEGDEYAVSHTKNRVSRIMSAGHGGQILLSQATADLVKRKLPEGVVLMDLGEHRLKGMEWLEHLYQVISPGLQKEFPPLSTSTARPNNLPLQMTSFIGREKEIAEVIGLIGKNRLVTLTGSGGVGKTRLSLRVAEHILDQFPNGAWLVELASLSDPDLVPRTTLTALRLQESTLQSPLNQLKNFLRDKELLLVLDNCEHVIGDCARLADEVLHACPKVKILSSSREALGVSGEISYHVPSLLTPDPRQMPSLEEMTVFAAVRLFTERAASVQPGFTITGSNAQAVAQVCRRLDGIPLAIELAAARVNVLSVEQIATRLNDRFRLLTGGSRTALPRQQTLRASIDWSFSLLDERERLLLMRLSVFYGGWTLEAACQVCSFGGLDEYEVIDGLAQLANKSLIVVESEGNGSKRYRMLETIRQFAREKLFDSGGVSLVRDQHLDFFTRLAETVEPHLRGPQQVTFLDQLEAEIDNLRLALEWALEEQVQKGVILATAIYWMWHIRGYRVEGEHWLDLLCEKLRLEPVTPAILPVLSKARICQSFLQLATGRIGPRTTSLVEEARSLADQLGEEGKASQVNVIHALAWNAHLNGQPSVENEFYLKGLAMAQALGDRFLIAEFLQNLSSNELDGAKGVRYAEQDLALRNELGDLDGQMMAYMLLAGHYSTLGRLEQAQQMLIEALKFAKDVKNRWGVMSSQYGLGNVYCESGNYPQSIAYLRQSLETTIDYGEYVWTILALLALGHTTELTGDWDASHRYFRQAVEISRLNHSRDWEVRSCISLAEAAWAWGDFELAEEFYQATVLAGQKEEEHFRTGAISYGLGKLAFMHGDLQAARGHFRQALEEALQQGNRYETLYCLEALTALSAHQPKKAALLSGVMEHFPRKHFDWSLVSLFLVSFDLDSLLEPARAALGEAKFEGLALEGQKLTLEQAVALALEE